MRLLFVEREMNLAIHKKLKQQKTPTVQAVFFVLGVMKDLSRFQKQGYVGFNRYIIVI